MEKAESRLKVLSEIRKERVGAYPYYIVSAAHSAHDHHFIVAADYHSETAELWVYPFRADMTRLNACPIQLTDILPRKPIATIHVNSIAFKPNASSLTPSHAEFIIGYRTGHLVVVEYKDRECKVRQRFNRALKSEGFFSRASSALFGGDESYAPYLKAPVRSFSLHPFTPNLYYIWQVGNTLLLQHELSEDREARFFGKHEAMDLDSFHLNFDIKKLIKDGDYYYYGCDHYVVLEHADNRMALIAFKEEVNSYANIPARQELAIGLASREEVLLVDHNHFILKSVVTLEIPLRNVGAFSSEGHEYLMLMPYENYLILYNLTAGRYCKLRGHRSYIGSAVFSRDGRVITAGMDHRICFIRLANIAASSWHPLLKEGSNQKIKEFEVADQKFDEIYCIGDTGSNSSSTRTNQSSYGYASIYALNDCYAIPTYDHKIILYAI